MNTNKVWQLGTWLLSSRAQTRLARPLSEKYVWLRIWRTSWVFFNNTVLHPFAHVLLLQNWVWSYYAVLKIRSNAEIVCHKQTVMIRVAGDIQSSSRRNSGGRRLVLKPLYSFPVLSRFCNGLLYKHTDDRIFDDFPTISEDFPKLFERPDKCSRTFSENFQKFPKMSDDFRRCFDDTPMNLSTII